MTKIKVMIIDDDDLDRYLAKRTLSNFEVFGRIAELPDGSDAAKLFASPDFIENWGPPPPTLVLLDINMLNMSGFELLDHVEQLDDPLASGWSSCVILMLTSSTHSRDRERAENYERVKGYVEKPISTKKVQQILDRYYGLSAASD